LAGTVLFGAFAVYRGQDSNWDLQHYHEYAGYALLHWRYSRDIAAAGVHSFFNPAPYAVPYLLRHLLSPVAGAFVLGALQSVVIWIVWALTRVLLPPGALLLRVAALVTAVTGGLTLSEVGASFADLPLAAPLLAALLLILQADADGVRHPLWRHAAAGMLAGLATGLKLTNVVFAVALAAAILVRPSRGLLARITRFGAGGVAGFLLGTGWWSLFLWRRYGNPFFPMFNTIFHAPDAVQWNFVDPSFRPQSLWDAVGIPWHWAAGEHVGAEVAFRDMRLALAGLMILVFMVLLASTGLTRLGATLRGKLIQAVAFLAVAFALWCAVFGIARYAIVLEVMAGLLAVPLASALAPAARLAVIGLAAVTIAWTIPGDWEHRPWDVAYQGPEWPAALARPGVFVLADTRLSYLAAYAPGKSLFFGLLTELMPPGGHLLAAMQGKILHPGPGGAWLVMHAPLQDKGKLWELASIGVAPGPDCVALAPLGWDGVTACRLVAAP
jgi:hypothetical protein